MIIRNCVTGRDSGKRVSQTSLLASVCLISCSPGVQEAFSYFLDFSQKEFVYVLLLNWCVYAGKKGPGLLTPPTC